MIQTKLSRQDACKRTLLLQTARPSLVCDAFLPASMGSFIPHKPETWGGRIRTWKQERLAHNERCRTMAWEQRGTQTYYYRSIRRNGRVTKDYLGTGPLAELSAAEDAERRAQRYTEAETWRQAQAALDALDRQIDAWWDMSTMLLKAILYTEGYYQHDRGAWRKRTRTGGGQSAPEASRVG